MDSSTDVEAANLKYQELTAGTKRLAKIRMILTATLVVVLIGFLAALYARITHMYNPQQFEPHLKAQAERLTPKIQASAKKVFKDVAPTYVKLARENFNASWPELRKKVSTEWTGMATRLSERSKTKLKETIREVHHHQITELQKYFPKLQDPVQREALRKRMEKNLEAQMGDILAEFEIKFVRKTHELEKTVMKFEDSRFEKFTEEELSRYFVHLWLRLVDEHLLEDIDKEKING